MLYKSQGCSWYINLSTEIQAADTNKQIFLLMENDKSILSSGHLSRTLFLFFNLINVIVAQQAISLNIDTSPVLSGTFVWPQRICGSGGQLMSSLYNIDPLIVWYDILSSINRT